MGSFDRIQGSFDKVQGSFDRHIRAKWGSFDKTLGSLHRLRVSFDRIQGSFDRYIRAWASCWHDINPGSCLRPSKWCRLSAIGNRFVAVCCNVLQCALYVSNVSYHDVSSKYIFISIYIYICIYIYINIYIHLCAVVYHNTFVDGYCSTVHVLLDWFEVDLGFTKLGSFTLICLQSVFFVAYALLSRSSRNTLQHTLQHPLWTSCSASPARWECL